MPDFKLEEMLSMISKWGIDKNANLSAVANYSALKKKLMLEKKNLLVVGQRFGGTGGYRNPLVSRL